MSAEIRKNMDPISETYEYIRVTRKLQISRFQPPHCGLRQFSEKSLRISTKVQIIFISRN